MTWIPVHRTRTSTETLIGSALFSRVHRTCRGRHWESPLQARLRGRQPATFLCCSAAKPLETQCTCSVLYQVIRHKRLLLSIQFASRMTRSRRCTHSNGNENVTDRAEVQRKTIHNRQLHDNKSTRTGDTPLHCQSHATISSTRCRGPRTKLHSPMEAKQETEQINARQRKTHQRVTSTTERLASFTKPSPPH